MSDIVDYASRRYEAAIEKHTHAKEHLRSRERAYECANRLLDDIRQNAKDNPEDTQIATDYRVAKAKVEDLRAQWAKAKVDMVAAGHAELSWMRAYQKAQTDKADERARKREQAKKSKPEAGRPRTEREQFAYEQAQQRTAEESWQENRHRRDEGEEGETFGERHERFNRWYDHYCRQFDREQFEGTQQDSNDQSKPKARKRGRKRTSEKSYHPQDAKARQTYEEFFNGPRTNFEREPHRPDPKPSEAQPPPQPQVPQNIPRPLQKAIDKWFSDLEAAFSNMSALQTFPQPPAWTCFNTRCREEKADRSLTACSCNIKELFRDKSLKKERLRFHPGKFGRCPEKVRSKIQKMAQEIFVVLNGEYNR